MKLHDLGPNEGHKKKKKRVGRGISAGQGKTAGRGTKGEGARRGKGGSLYRQGGQLPFYRSLPFKRGFTKIRRINYAEVNVDRLGDFPAGTELDPTVLAEAGLLKGKGDLPVALLGRGNIKQALTIKVHKASQTAIEKVEKAGGTVVILE
jgi:large subunit ribosomal protein L15